MIKSPAFLSLVLTLVLPFTSAFAQRNRITGRIDNARRVGLSGHIHPKATAENDEGAVDSGMVLPNVTLVLKPSAAQQSDLEQFLADQQNPSSPDFHRWLTPDQFADRFGVSQADIDRIVSWVRDQGLTVTAVARARNSISLSGTAAAIQNTFRTQIHRYRVNGEAHFANSSDPSIPAALQGMIEAVHGLTDFRLKPARHVTQPVADYTSSTGRHYLAPDDLALIYNIKALYNGGFTGASQKIAIVGQTHVDLADVRQFRTFFNLPANDPQLLLVPNTNDPGTSQEDLGEANLDLQWSGAVARNATIIYVYSPDVMTSVQYAIDQNVAPVLSMSYGSCEAANYRADAATIQTWARQANAQGITWFNASGDAGGADCAGGASSRYATVTSVDFPASIPEVTGVGGTEFNEGAVTYWNTSGDSNHASVLSYIPETSWNDSAANGQPSASGGGASIFFAKPSWQSGTGVPNDGARDVPDVALSASADHDGYLTYNGGNLQVVGGTSAGAPTFAGITALLNQYLVSSGVQASAGLGNINPQLYSLARTAPAVFHDITTGNNIVTIACRTRGCTPATMGFNAGAGYDQVTGLGSVDAFALATSWKTGTTPPATLPANPAITAVGNAASYSASYAPGMVLSIFGSQLAPATQATASTPLPLQIAGVSVTINGMPAPLYYISQGQLNVQIPYETAAGPATLKVNNNGLSASTAFTVAAAAPGIFTDAKGAPVPSTSAGRNQLATLYITGFGPVTPPLATGVGPAVGTPVGQLPQPQQKVAMTIGGVSVQNLATAVPWGYVGVLQINYQVPAGAPLGAQPVIVSVGGISSAPATLTVTP
ncbi:MAG: hypothetical protein C5B51_26120 [Terriglobia bacterium]|nr:MAG: hypothetical protein C5B51_26120 [Terriglobia bacterium]